MGAHTIGVPCDIGDLVYKVSVKKQEIKPWYVQAIQKNSSEEGWVVIVKDNKNKYKYNERTFKFRDFGEIVFTNRNLAKKALEDYSIPRKVTIVHKCKHTSQKEIAGTPLFRKNRIEWLSRQLCPDCRNAESEKQGKSLVEMPYKEFKLKYPENDTKKDSYDPEKKTIEVNV